MLCVFMDLHNNDADGHVGPRHVRNSSGTPHHSENHGSTSTDLNRLLNSTACNVSFGVVLLLIGIVVTSMTFKEYRSTNKVFLLGPILVGAGVLGIAKALLRKYHFREGQHRRHRRRSRHNRISRTSHSERTDSDSLVYGDNLDPIYRSRRGAPPPYDIVAIVTSTSALLPTSQIIGVHVPALPNYSEIDPLPPPPKYEEVLEGVVVTDGVQTAEVQENSLNNHNTSSFQSSTATNTSVQTQDSSSTVPHPKNDTTDNEHVEAATISDNSAISEDASETNEHRAIANQVECSATPINVVQTSEVDCATDNSNSDSGNNISCNTVQNSLDLARVHHFCTDISSVLSVNCQISGAINSSEEASMAPQNQYTSTSLSDFCQSDNSGGQTANISEQLGENSDVISDNTIQ